MSSVDLISLLGNDSIRLTNEAVPDMADRLEIDTLYRAVINLIKPFGNGQFINVADSKHADKFITDQLEFKGQQVVTESGLTKGLAVFENGDNLDVVFDTMRDGKLHIHVVRLSKDISGIYYISYFADRKYKRRNDSPEEIFSSEGSNMFIAGEKFYRINKYERLNYLLNPIAPVSFKELTRKYEIPMP